MTVLYVPLVLVTEVDFDATQFQPRGVKAFDYRLQTSGIGVWVGFTVYAKAGPFQGSILGSLNSRLDSK